MELGSKVTALEEEIAVLKGEIKTILQEVRTAVLARENPFATDSREAPQASPSDAEPAPVPGPESPRVVPLPAAEPEDAATAPNPFVRRDETDAARHASPERRRWSISSLAALVAWTQEAATRLDAGDLDVVLSLARYGGLIDEELEATLTRLAAPLAAPASAPKQKGVSQYLLALRELSALIEEAEAGYRVSGPMRRAS